MPSSPEATPAVAPVIPNMIVVVQDIALRPAVAEDTICGKLMAAGGSGGLVSVVSGRGCFGAKEVCRSWNRKDCTVQTEVMNVAKKLQHLHNPVKLLGIPGSVWSCVQSLHRRTRGAVMYPWEHPEYCQQYSLSMHEKVADLSKGCDGA